MRSGFGLFLYFIFSLSPAWADEWWAWSWMEAWHENQSSAGVFLANRYDDDDRGLLQLVSPRFKNQISPWLEMGLGLSFLRLKDITTNDHELQVRPEIELNPHFDITPELRLDWRNRLEWRWNERESLKTSRFRQRLQFSHVLPKAFSPWTRLFVSNEWLIDLNRHQWTENRLVPLGMTFKTGRRSDLDLFYMQLSTKIQESWQHESMFVTYWKVRF